MLGLQPFISEFRFIFIFVLNTRFQDLIIETLVIGSSKKLVLGVLPFHFDIQQRPIIFTCFI